MPRSKSSANNASKPKVAQVSTPVGKPNQSVAAIREEYKLTEDRQKANFAKASEDKIMRTIRDIAQNSSASATLTATDKETIRNYLTGNIYSNATNLINASKYLYFRSPIYAQIIDKYASMYCWDCRKIEPKYTFQKDIDSAKVLKTLDVTLDYLDIMGIPNNILGPITNMWIADVSFNLYFHDDIGSFFYPIDPSEAIIDSVYEADSGWCLGMAMDMSKWRSKDRQALIEWLGSPLDEMYKEYQRTNVKYIHVPAEYSFVLKKRINSISTVIPPLLPYLSQLANLNDLVDSQSTADELSFYKLIYLYFVYFY